MIEDMMANGASREAAEANLSNVMRYVASCKLREKIMRREIAFTYNPEAIVFKTNWRSKDEG
jgi:hypothetical protein